ncbi:MAG: metallophosphoesterase [Bacteroidia bacterium]|nr:metallophosphoesterase [Bacteroidia bacterium]
MLIFGGVYSNLQSLEQMQALARTHGIPPDRILCTGDIVGYCAQPLETVRAVIDWGIQSIAGNVEIQLREGETDCGCDFNAGGRCDLFSRQWYPYAQSCMDQVALAWMKTLPDFIRFEWERRQCTVVHGSYFETSEYVFQSTPWPVKAANFAAAHCDLILAGHCGLPFHHHEEGLSWINPGVIGMPANDGTPRVWYLLMEPGSEPQFRHLSYSYDHLTAARLMRETRLPQPYALTLETGLWDNCEILPEAETAAQGRKIAMDI